MEHPTDQLIATQNSDIMMHMYQKFERRAYIYGMIMFLTCICVTLFVLVVSVLDAYYLQISITTVVEECARVCAE